MPPPTAPCGGNCGRSCGCCRVTATVTTPGPIVAVTTTGNGNQGTCFQDTVNLANGVSPVVGNSLAVTPSGLFVPMSMMTITPEMFGAKGDGTTDDHAAFQSATDLCAATGGVVSVRAVTYRWTTGITISGTRVNILGADSAGTRIEYAGSGVAIDVSSPAGYVSIENMRLVNVGTGTKGILMGPTGGGSTAMQNRLTNVDVQGFSVANIHLSDCELGRFENVYAQNGGGVGFLLDNLRGTGAINNLFSNCRALTNAGDGWDVNYIQLSQFLNCQGLGNNPGNASGWQFRVRGTTSGLSILGLDVEDAAASGTSGLTITGTNHRIDSVVGFKLNQGIVFNTATGCFLGVTRWSTVTTPIVVGATSTVTILDGGNLGTVTDASNVANYIGQKVRAPVIGVTGLTGAALPGRFVGETASGAPASGTFVVGDFVVTRAAELWVCTVAGSPGTWVALGGGWNPPPIRKTADETVNNSSTRQDDDHLFFSIAASEVWVGEFTLFVIGSAVADFKYALTTPAGATLMHGGFASRVTDALITGTELVTVSDTPVAIVGVNAVGSVINIKFHVANSTTAGSVKLNWAQGTATSADTTVKAGSFLSYRRAA